MSSIDNLVKLVDDTKAIIYNTKYLSLKHYSEASDIPQSTLHYYDSIGLINIVNVNGIDCIANNTMTMLKAIRLMTKEYGVNLAGARYILYLLSLVDKHSSLESKIHKYASLCGMKHDYRESRIYIHDKKYSR